MQTTRGHRREGQAEEIEHDLNPRHPERDQSLLELATEQRPEAGVVGQDDDAEGDALDPRLGIGPHRLPRNRRQDHRDAGEPAEFDQSAHLPHQEIAVTDWVESGDHGSLDRVAKGGPAGDPTDGVPTGDTGGASGGDSATDASKSNILTPLR